MNDMAFRIGKLQAGITVLSSRVEKMNSCHEASSGKFCSTGGGGGGGKKGLGRWGEPGEGLAEGKRAKITGRVQNQGKTGYLEESPASGYWILRTGSGKAIGTYYHESDLSVSRNG